MTNLIWDLDGTLFDSYPIIVKRIQESFKQFNLQYSYDEIYENLIRTTTFDFLLTVSEKHSIKIGSLLNALKKVDLDYSSVQLTPHIKEFLESTKDNKNIRHFIYTHRDHKTTHFLLFFLEIEDYFVEVVDEAHTHFVRKPDCESLLYLIDKYNFNKENTYYIGDRRIDAECAKRADVKSIFFNSSNVKVDHFDYDYEIKDILEINNIIKHG